MKRLLMTTCLALACVAAAPAPPRTALPAVEARLKGCLARTGTTMGIDACNGIADAAADAILNRLYAAWTARLKHADGPDAHDDGEILKRLVVSERAWVAYRDADCSLESTSMLGGTGESNVYGGCLYARTRDRILVLQRVSADR